MVSEGLGMLWDKLKRWTKESRGGLIHCSLLEVYWKRTFCSFVLFLVNLDHLGMSNVFGWQHTWIDFLLNQRSAVHAWYEPVFLFCFF